MSQKTFVHQRAQTKKVKREKTVRKMEEKCLKLYI